MSHYLFTSESVTEGHPDKICYTQTTIEHLIKSGGGNGPVKPGNLQFCVVPNPAVRRKMRLC